MADPRPFHYTIDNPVGKRCMQWPSYISGTYEKRKILMVQSVYSVYHGGGGAPMTCLRFSGSGASHNTLECKKRSDVQLRLVFCFVLQFKSVINTSGPDYIRHVMGASPVVHAADALHHTVRKLHFPSQKGWEGRPPTIYTVEQQHTGISAERRRRRRNQRGKRHRKTREEEEKNEN